MTTRSATPQDLMTVFNFRKALCEEERESILGPRELCTLMETVSGTLAADSASIILFMDGENPVGTIWVMAGASYGASDGYTITADYLYFLPEYRRTKHIMEIWESVHELADKHEITKIQGHVSSENTKVYDMWMKRGARVKAYVLEKDHPATYEMPKSKREKEPCNGR